MLSGSRRVRGQKEDHKRHKTEQKAQKRAGEERNTEKSSSHEGTEPRSRRVREIEKIQRRGGAERPKDGDSGGFGGCCLLPPCRGGLGHPIGYRKSWARLRAQGRSVAARKGRKTGYTLGGLNGVKKLFDGKQARL